MFVIVLDTRLLIAYMGESIPDRLSDPYKKEIYRVNWEQLHINYGDNVDFERLRNQILLCSETRDVIYAPPKPVKYRKGSRPLLEKYAADAVCGCSGKWEEALALMCFCRDLYKKHDNEQLFYGGTEEELIKKGERLCECLGRLMVALCEVRGIPARTVMHVVTGHITSEVFIDGKWVYVDPRCGLFYLKKDGVPASVEECMNDRGITLIQPEWVKKYASPLWSFEYRAMKNKTKYFNPREIQCYCDYSLADADRYHYEWKSVGKAARDGLFSLNQRYDELTELIFGQEEQEENR